MSSELGDNYYCIMVDTGIADENTGKSIKYFSKRSFDGGFFSRGGAIAFKRLDAAESLSEGRFSLEELDGITASFKDQTDFLANFFDDEVDLTNARVYIYQIIKNKERPPIFDSIDTKLFCTFLKETKETRRNNSSIDIAFARNNDFTLMCNGICYINRLIDLVFKYRGFLEAHHKELELYNIDLIRTVVLRDSAYVEHTKKKRTISNDFGETTRDIDELTRQSMCSYEMLRDLFVLLNAKEKENDKYYLRRDYKGQVSYWDFKRGVLLDSSECHKESEGNLKNGLMLIEGISLSKIDQFTSSFYNDLELEEILDTHITSKEIKRYYPRAFHRPDYGEFISKKSRFKGDYEKPVYSIERAVSKTSDGDEKEEQAKERLMPIYGKIFRSANLDPESFFKNFDSYGVYAQDSEAIKYERAMTETIILNNLLFEIKKRITAARDILAPTEAHSIYDQVRREDWFEYASYRKLRELFGTCLSLESTCTKQLVKRYEDEKVNVNQKLTLFAGDYIYNRRKPNQDNQS